MSVIILLAAVGAASPPLPGERFTVERYAVDLRPDIATGAVSGVETIVVRATAALDRLAFSPNPLTIEAATLAGRAVMVTRSAGVTQFVLPQPLRRGEYATLRFRFAGMPSRGLTAVPAGVYAGYFACDWMVCLQDAPGMKAPLALNLVVPAGTETLAPGRRIGTTALPGGLVRHHWRARPYPAYLFAFAAGRIAAAREDGFVYADMTDGGLSGSLRRHTPRMAAFFAEKAGMPMPDPPYAQLVVPGGDAQETAGFAILGRATLDGETADPTGAWIAAHEMAHRWWGNLVTCATWRDFWLNEGIATFMVAAWQQRANGEAAYRRHLDIARERVAVARAAGFDRPLTWSGSYPSLRIRRAIQYSKGALFLAHLREDLGEAAFWRGIRDYTRRHAGRTVTSADLQRAMERASGRGLASEFREWVYG